MKIGKFAEKNNVSIDTLRHYMNLELIIPNKINKQFEFDARCQRDFEEIIYLKKLGFNLSEIKNIFIVKQLGRMTAFQKNDYYKDIFLNKLYNVTASLDKLIEEKNVLEKEICRLNTIDEPACLDTGICLSWLNLIRCINCNKTPILKKADVTNNMIIEGILRCSCGNEYLIKNGILYVDPVEPNEEQFPDVISYIQNTDNEYLHQLYKSMEWNYSNINFNHFENKTVLELGCGSGFFLRRIYDALPESTVYIAIDRDIKRIRYLKSVLDKAEIRKNILFMCCDFNNIPLNKNSIDIVCDYTGTSNYCFEHKEFLLFSLKEYLKNTVSLLGSYLTFKNFSRDSSVSPEYRPNFQINNIKQQLKNLGFAVKNEFISDSITKGGIYEDYFKHNEQIIIYCFIGERLG